MFPLKFGDLIDMCSGNGEIYRYQVDAIDDNFCMLKVIGRISNNERDEKSNSFISSSNILYIDDCFFYN